jgi:hypothetical protein
MARNLGAFLLLVALCALLVVTQEQRSDDQLARLLAGADILDAAVVSQTRESLERVTRSTRFEDRWTVDAPFSTDKLNVYLVDSRAASAAVWVTRFPNLRRNCTSSPGGKIIVCDLALADEIASRAYEVATATETHEVARAMILRWMLSHEVGHLVLGHRGVHFFADPTRAETRSAPRVYAQEREADDFAASNLFDGDDAWRMERLLVDLASSEVVRKTGTPMYGVGILYNYDKPVHYTEQCSHPAYVIRAYTLLQRAADVRHEDSLAAMLKSFGRMLRDDESPCPIESQP